MGQMEDVSSFSMPSASALAPVSSFSFSQASAPAAPASNPNTQAIIQQAIARNKKLMAEKAAEAESAQVQQATVISAPKPAHVAVAKTV